MVNHNQDNKQFLILVDEKDKEWSKLEKLEVHKLGLLHRAFSVFIFNTKGELLLQQRADDKYHSASLWSNTCCSHPQYGEDLEDAIERRLYEELELKVKTEFLFSFIYKIEFVNGLTEHEFDHVHFGITDQKPKPNSSEIKNIKYIKLNDLKRDLEQNPLQYTEWLRLCLNDVIRNRKLEKAFRNESSDDIRQF